MTDIGADQLCEQMAIPPKGEKSQLEQLKHRAKLIQIWQNGGINFKGARVIDVGCGQGDQTVALLGVKDIKEVVGADPGPPDYGELTLTVCSGSDGAVSGTLFKIQSYLYRSTFHTLPGSK